ncbi:MAG: pilus assembly protein PilM, partial [SAR324 cluster bacterium]|nr:pilus assembly protein PilM [SAR324 cluster bacterium]
VKNEIIDSFLNAIEMAGLGVAIVDVDCFALQNVFEVNYPELFDKTVALVNIGLRYSSINICKGGSSLFTGDIAVGGKVFTDAIAEVFSLSYEEAERLKVSGDKTNPLYDAAVDILRKNVDQVAIEFNRQLSFFWNASGSDEGIDHIFVNGGGACTPGLVEELADKTGIECEVIDPFRTIEISSSLDANYVKSVAPLMGICVGLAMREPSDKIIPIAL